MMVFLTCPCEDMGCRLGVKSVRCQWDTSVLKSMNNFILDIIPTGALCG